jgi:SAM-dependent methyltransferase
MEVISCPICRCEEYHKVYHGTVKRGQVDVTCVICTNCTHLYLNPRPSLEAYAKFYDEDDYGRVALAVKKKSYSERSRMHDDEFFQERTRHGTRLYEEYLKGKLTKNDIVFDFGAGDGAWLLGLHQATGCTIDGIEPMSLQVQFIKRRLGVDIFHAPIEDVADKVVEKYRGRIKLVIACDSLEHMLDPMKCLNIARSILVDGGYLYICNWDIFHRMGQPAAAGRLLGECLSIDHTHYFHRNSYTFTVQKAGFEILSFESVSTIREKTDHMEILARKASIPGQLTPKLECRQILSEMAVIESNVKRYRARSLHYRLRPIVNKARGFVRKALAGSESVS